MASILLIYNPQDSRLMTLNTPRKIEKYIKALSNPSFTKTVIRTYRGRTTIVSQLLGRPKTRFKQVHSPYTRGYLGTIPPQTHVSRLTST